MKDSASVGLYSSLLRFYPRGFREEYGPDMTLLFAQQLRDEAAVRVWGRGLLDLALTIPTLRLELLMTGPASSKAPLPLALGALSIAFAAVAVAAGTVSGVVAVALALAVLTAALAVVAWRRSRPLVGPTPVAQHWWKLLLGGAVALTALVVGTTVTGELPGGLWVPTMLLGLFSLSALIGGVLLGVAHLMHERSTGTTS